MSRPDDAPESISVRMNAASVPILATGSQAAQGASAIVLSVADGLLARSVAACCWLFIVDFALAALSAWHRVELDPAARQFRATAYGWRDHRCER